jgi:hypothetical protein
MASVFESVATLFPSESFFAVNVQRESSRGFAGGLFATVTMPGVVTYRLHPHSGGADVGVDVASFFGISPADLTHMHSFRLDELVVRGRASSPHTPCRSLRQGPHLLSSLISCSLLSVLSSLLSPLLSPPSSFISRRSSLVCLNCASAHDLGAGVGLVSNAVALWLLEQVSSAEDVQAKLIPYIAKAAETPADFASATADPLSTELRRRQWISTRGSSPRAEPLWFASVTASLSVLAVATLVWMSRSRGVAVEQLQ